MVSRRDFLKMCGTLGAGFLGLKVFAETLQTQQGYGPLLPDPQGILKLPKGFSYKIISRKGETMNDGLLVPGLADGMAAFPGTDGRVVLIRNHEVSSITPDQGPFGVNYELLDKLSTQKIYDFGKGQTPSLGGTTTVVYNPKTQEVERQFLSLAGTIRNCAGGPTPWNSWISCEEVVLRAGEHTNTRNPEQPISFFTDKDHGYNFEVPVTEKIQVAAPIPLKEMGRFNHEAVAVDARTSIVYETEDRHDGLFYRYIPNQAGQLHKGGKLQALAIRGQKSTDTRNWPELQTAQFPIGELVEVEWIDLENVESPQDDLRQQGFSKGAARFARGEGIWYGDGEFYFACTNGGQKQHGQIFRYIPSAFEGKAEEHKQPGKLELFAEPNDSDIMQNCDNLTIAPWGDVYLCEDNPHPFIVAVTKNGEFFKFAENTGFRSELAGITFSPWGETMFVNIQGPGLTFAITGPWQA